MGFYDNFVMLCNKAGKKPSKVALEIGISKSIVSRWKSGGGATDATARKVADYFGVPVSELTGIERKPMTVSDLMGDVSIADTVMETVRRQNKKPTDQMASGLHATDYDKLTPENKRTIDALIEQLLKAQSVD